MKTIKIQVTQEHIRAGVNYEGALCPLALAVQPHFKEPICIFARHINFKKYYSQAISYKRQPIQLPLLACQFYSNFDRGIPIEPFEFKLEIPDALS